MARVIFYEKPGCKGGTRQKVLLTAAGHEVITYNLLTEPWTVERLRSFFGDRREVGFDVETLETWIGLKPVDESFRAMSENLMSQDLQGCAHGNGHSHDHHHDHQGGCNHHGQQEHHRQGCNH